MPFGWRYCWQSCLSIVCRLSSCESGNSYDSGYSGRDSTASNMTLNPDLQVTLVLISGVDFPDHSVILIVVVVVLYTNILAVNKYCITNTKYKYIYKNLIPQPSRLQSLKSCSCLINFTQDNSSCYRWYIGNRTKKLTKPQNFCPSKRVQIISFTPASNSW